MQLPTNIFAEQGKKTGRTSLIEPGELNILAEFVALDSTRILQIMKRDFIHYFHGNNIEQPYSLSTFQRAMHKAELSIKTVERRNILCNDEEGLNFLDRIAHINLIFLLFGDEMSSDPKSFHKKLGWSPVGEECKRYQVVIGSRTFSSAATVCSIGFTAWQIFEGYFLFITYWY